MVAWNRETLNSSALYLQIGENLPSMKKIDDATGMVAGSLSCGERLGIKKLP